MSQHIHEELEVGQHLDQTVRTALTGLAQLLERAVRTSADRDRATAQDLREQALRETVLSAQHVSGTREPAPGQTNGLGGDAQSYLDRAEGNGAGRAARAWASAMRDVTGDPGTVGGAAAAAAASQLGEHTKRRYGVDLAATLAALLSDGQANAASQHAEQAAVAAATREAGLVDAAAAAVLPTATVLPVHGANPDRGVSPSRAGSPQEAQHRRQTWDLARTAWEATRPDLDTPAAQKAAWDALPIQDKTAMFWKQYDTEPARTLTATASPWPAPAPAAAADANERGMAPSKAPNAAERDHREAAWAAARAGFTGTLPEGTAPAEAKKAWDGLDWPDKALRYWTAYDSTATRPAGETPAPAEAAATDRRARVIELNEQAAAWFAEQASPGSKGRDYLEQRLGAAVVDEGRWGLGYAPPGWTNLTGHLRSTGATDDEIVAAGLGHRSSRGNVVDAFRDRAMVAIRDDAGDTVGFVGRDLSGDPGAPKYVNTTSTPAYTKSEHLLGVHEAPVGARLVRVEGPFDAIAVTAAGDGKAAGVAPLGTALTPAQAHDLAHRSEGRVWLALDGDRAGSAATENDYWLLQERGVDARVLPLPKGADPAQLWQDNPEMLRTLLHVADAAPTAGVAVIDNTVEARREDLLGGDADAYDDIAATEDRVAASLPNDQDRALLRAHTTTKLDEFSDQPGAAAIAAGSAVGVEHASSPALAEGFRPDPQDHGNPAVDAPNSSSELGTPAGHAGQQPGRPEGAAGAYDRASETQLSGVGDPEAAQARIVSAHGYTRPTRDMLDAAHNRPGSPARQSMPDSPVRGRSKTELR